MLKKNISNENYAGIFKKKWPLESSLESISPILLYVNPFHLILCNEYIKFIKIKSTVNSNAKKFLPLCQFNSNAKERGCMSVVFGVYTSGL